MAAARADVESPGAFLRLDVFGDLGSDARFAAAYTTAVRLLRRSGARELVRALRVDPSATSR